MPEPKVDGGKRRRLRLRRGVLIGALVAWGLFVAAGLSMAALHGVDGHVPGQAPVTWPADTTLLRSPVRGTLLVFAHPRCPCTRATLAELARLRSRVGDDLDIRVALFHPMGTPGSWSEGALWTSATSIPGVTVVADEGGVEARRFEATSSGTAVLYDRGGVLRFRGGITPARGHEGDSDGADAIVSWARGSSAVPQSMVFGCEIRNAPRNEGSGK